MKLGLSIIRYKIKGARYMEWCKWKKKRRGERVRKRRIPTNQRITTLDWFLT
jgi:hypothetical protein